MTISKIFIEVTHVPIILYILSVTRIFLIKLYQKEMKPILLKVGMCSLNNNPLSFKRNLKQIIESI